MNRLRLRVGMTELEYEGDESFSKSDILQFVERLSKAPASKVVPPAEPPGGSIPNDKTLDLGVDSIAVRLGAKSGPDLLLAAAAYLETAGGKTTYSRKEIHEAAKTASGHYNTSVAGNLSNYLQSLVRGRKLNRRGDGQYSLSAPTKSQVIAKLA